MARERVQNARDVMLYVGGSKRSFHCDCGCNVFRRIGETNRYRCNSCAAVYVGEVRHAEA